MWYFEYSYDSTAVPKPKRSVTGSTSPNVPSSMAVALAPASPTNGTRYWFVGRNVRS